MRVAGDAGFSLVEVLAAMFIAALAGAAVVVAIPQSPPAEAQAAQALAGALQRAQRAALVEGATLGLTLAPSRYRFAVWEDGAWRDLDARSGLGPRDWPDGALVALSRDDPGDAGPQRREGAPDLVFDAAGGAGAFSIHIEGRDGRAIVRGGADGAIVMETPGG